MGLKKFLSYVNIDTINFSQKISPKIMQENFATNLITPFLVTENKTADVDVI